MYPSSRRQAANGCVDRSTHPMPCRESRIAPSVKPVLRRREDKRKSKKEQGQLFEDAGIGYSIPICAGVSARLDFGAARRKRVRSQRERSVRDASLGRIAGSSSGGRVLGFDGNDGRAHDCATARLGGRPRHRGRGRHRLQLDHRAERPLPSEGDFGPARQRGPIGGAAARRRAVPGRHLLELHELLRQELGAREVDHLPRGRQSRVPDVRRFGLLRLLQRRRQRHRPGRRPQQGLLQLRHRHLAHDLAQLE